MVTLLDDVSLKAQIKQQRQHAWDIDRDIDWALGIDRGKYFLPLDEDCIAFPGATADQRRVLSQYMGLVVNATIGEMENVIHKLKDTAWETTLRKYPVNPEMFELGELFFQEEAKHSAAFGRFIDIFCANTGVVKSDLSQLMPKALGSLFLKAVMANARSGGHAFWWVVASVEEVSIEIYRQMHRHQSEIDPLYFQVHRRHLEDEARHRNYAFLMLELIEKSRPKGYFRLRRRADLLIAQFFCSGWVISELHKVFESRRLASRHPFFAELASCLPLIEKLSVREIVHRLFVSAPYISHVLNTRFHKHVMRAASVQKVLSFPWPNPQPSPTFTVTPELGSGERR